jgi:hypothetical protein
MYNDYIPPIYAAMYWYKHRHPRKPYRFILGRKKPYCHRHKWRIKRMKTNKRCTKLIDWQYVISHYYAANKIGYR